MSKYPSFVYTDRPRLADILLHYKKASTSILTSYNYARRTPIIIVKHHYVHGPPILRHHFPPYRCTWKLCAGGFGGEMNGLVL